MKIAFLHATLGLLNRGSERFVDIVADALARQHKVQVIHAGPSKRSKYRSIIINHQRVAYPQAPLNFIQKILFRFHLDKRARSAMQFTHASLEHLRRFEADIVVATNGSKQVSLLKHNLPRAKIVVFGHAGIGHDDLSNLKATPDLFVALSHSALVWAKEHQRIGTKVVYIPNPVESAKSHPVTLALPHPIVMCVAALSQYKNVASVIEATSSLGYSLLLIGDGELSHQINSLLSKYQGEFRWIKNVEPTSMPAYYASSDVFCFVPDHQEAFGRVYLEAMVAGLPIVATSDEIRRSIVGEQGIYVEPNDVEAIAKSIVTALSIKGRIDYSKQLKPYLMNNVIKAIEKTFYDLVKN